MHIYIYMLNCQIGIIDDLRSTHFGLLPNYDTCLYTSYFKSNLEQLNQYSILRQFDLTLLNFISMKCIYTVLTNCFLLLIIQYIVFIFDTNEKCLGNFFFYFLFRLFILVGRIFTNLQTCTICELRCINFENPFTETNKVLKRDRID